MQALLPFVPTLVARTNDDGVQVGLAVEPGPGYAGDECYSFEGDGSSPLFSVAQCRYGFRAVSSWPRPAACRMWRLLSARAEVLLVQIVCACARFVVERLDDPVQVAEDSYVHLELGKSNAMQCSSSATRGVPAARHGSRKSSAKATAVTHPASTSRGRTQRFR